MKKKLLISALAALGLFTFSSKPVSAAKHSYFWWEKPRTVRVTKKVAIYKMDSRIPTYRRRPTKIGHLRPGRIVKINHGWSYLWIVRAKGLTYNRRYAWISNSDNWYSLNLHPRKKPVVKKRRVSTSVTSTDIGEYVDGQDNYHDNGIILEKPSRFNFTAYNREDDGKFVKDSSDYYVGFRVTINNTTSHAINAGTFLQNHLQLLDSNMQEYTVTNSVTQVDGHNSKFWRNGDSTKNGKEISINYANWPTYLSNFNKNVASHHKLIVMFIHYVPKQSDLKQTYLLNVLGENGNQFNTLIYPSEINIRW